jgi:hypothetical protein
LPQAVCRATLAVTDKFRPQEYPDTVLTTWNVSLAEAERESPIAGDLLQLLAFLAPEDIPRNLLTMPVEIAFLLFDLTNAIVVLITTIAIVQPKQ